jgi:tetratricopeptide (TPR) repeat protein
MAKSKFKYDVFISYSHKDEEWVRNILLPTLEKQGLKVCIDYRDFIAGKPAIINMQDASEASRHTVLVLTPKWVESEWTLYESILSRTDDPSGLQRRTIPLHLEKCKPPKFISMLSWVDFTDKKRETDAWQNLFKSLDKEVEKVEVAKAEPDSWYLAHPYPMPPNFTGRATEQKMLDGWLAENTNRLFILRALGGFGKSALAWQWINTHVNPAEWTKLVWWSFYEGDASFEHFIEETLKYLKLEVPQGQRPQVDELLKAMQSQNILLIMDGFERALRAYSGMNAAYQGDEEPKYEDNQLDCVNINAEIFLKGVCSLPNIKGKVLMTTRLTPRAVKPRGEFMLGCREEELTAMQKADAVEFFRKQKIKGLHAEIEAACAPYGYHPLSLRLLAGRILKDFENPADIIVAQKLKIDGDLKQHQHHVLEVSYNSLPPPEGKLLSTIACFRSPVELKTLESIAENKNSLDADLHDLVDRGLLHFDGKNKKFDLHPIVRRYAYERLTAPDRTAAHTRLHDYFAAMPKPEKVEKLEDLDSVIELYQHTVRANEWNFAWILYRERLWITIYYQLGAYQTQIELLRALFKDGEDKPPKVEYHQAHVLNELANAYGMSGQPRRAIPLFLAAKEFNEKRGDKKSIVISLGNTAQFQLVIGALRAAEATLRSRVELCQELNDEFNETISHRELGRLLIYQGAWGQAETELEHSWKLFEKEGNFQSSGQVCLFRALRLLLMARDLNQSSIKNTKSALEYAQRALELAEETARRWQPFERDFVRAYWLLGVAYRIYNQLDLADIRLNEALVRDRAINLVEDEANILLDLARLRYDQKNHEEARSLAEEALLITERCGYVLQGADVNLFLAQYALEQEKDKVKAKEYAEEAKKLATCDGPPYYYKVAYEEAERMLKELG